MTTAGRWFDVKNARAAASEARHEALRLFCVVFKTNSWRWFVGDDPPFDECPLLKGDIYDWTNDIGRLLLKEAS